MIIETQTTPDINVMNFFPPVQIIKSGAAEFVDAKSIRKSPLAENIFDLGGVASLFITNDMISVTKDSKASWDNLKPQILAEIMDYITIGEEPIIEDKESNLDEVAQKIQGLISARIRPAIQQDGGDIVFKGFENGIVYVELKGNCVGCPYALVTLKEGVEKILKTYIPEVKSVQNFESGKTQL